MCLGIPGKIVEIVNTEDKLAMVDVAGVKRQINITCIVDEDHTVESCVGNWVLIHVGFAMSRINEEEAAKTLDLFRELGEIQDEPNAPQNLEEEKGDKDR